MDRIALDCVSTGSSEKRKRCRSSGAALARALRRLRSGAWPILPVLRRSAPAGLGTAAARPASRCDVPGGLAVTGGGSGSSLKGRGAWRGDQLAWPWGPAVWSGDLSLQPRVCRGRFFCSSLWILEPPPRRELEFLALAPAAQALHQRLWRRVPRKGPRCRPAVLLCPGKIPANQALAALTWSAALYGPIPRPAHELRRVCPPPGPRHPRSDTWWWTRSRPVNGWTTTCCAT